MTNKNLIEALLVERDGYARRKLIERVEAIDATLQELGYGVKEIATLDPSTERATPPKSRKRRK